MNHYNERTPSGAASWSIVFLDDSGNPIDESNATRWEIHEYDEHNLLLRSHFGYFAD